jgi:hypothetical protein
MLAVITTSLPTRPAIETKMDTAYYYPGISLKAVKMFKQL